MRDPHPISGSSHSSWRFAMAEIKRGEFLAGAAGTAALVGIAGSAGQATAAPATSRAGIPVQLRQGTDIAAQLSPDSAQLAFQSYRAGNFDLWLIGSDGSGLRQLTHGPFDYREPRFSPDGRS